MLKKLKERFQKFFNIEDEGEMAALAALTHPRFKNRWNQCLSRELQNKVKLIALQALEKLTNDERTENQPVIEDDFFEFGPTVQNNSPLSCQGDHEIKLMRFLQSSSTSLQSLENFPLIKRIFIKCNTSLPSSAPVKRLFSYATMINLPKYNRLSDTLFEKRVLAAANARKAYK